MNVELRNKKDAVIILGLYYMPPNSEQETKEQICRYIMEKC